MLNFPFEKLPEIYVPQSTVIALPDESRVHAYRWCYLERKLPKNFSELNTASLSSARIEAMPKAIERLSKRALFERLRPATIQRHFQHFSQFLDWVDAAEHERRFEHVLTDADLALEALKNHHTYLRQQLQAHQIGSFTAASRDQDAIAILSEVHSRTFLDEIEPHSRLGSRATDVPRDEQVGQWMSMLQAIFDSAARLVLRGASGTGKDIAAPRVIRLCATDDTKTNELAENYSEARLMELACMAFAGLAIGDSGTNLSQIQRYEEPEDLQEQLAEPDRVNLTHKVIKFRARGEFVPVHLTTTTLSRLPTYLSIRAHLISHLSCPDIAPLFVQAKFASVKGLHRTEAVAIRALHGDFLQYLRHKVETMGAELPPITLRQLRTYKQQNVVRKKGVQVASAVMGHSVATAVRAYCRVQEDVRRGEMGKFLSSLESRVLEHVKSVPETGPIVSIPSGGCKDHGKPIPIEPEPLVQPDCRKTEGCFFCVQFRVHADEQDVRKLVSCRFVLQRLAPLQGESTTADRVWVAVTDRIDALLLEIRGRIPIVYEETRRDVEERGNLSRYWTAKLQQLYLLGMLRRVV